MSNEGKGERYSDMKNKVIGGRLSRLVIPPK